MVHALKFEWKLGLGFVNQNCASRIHAFVEFGYFFGSILFAYGTLYFFPVEGLEDFRVGCRFYEVGSVVFGVLTLYSELDRYHARHLSDTQREVTRRELLEEAFYCLGSFVFLVGTFLFDPPIVKQIAATLSISGNNIENTAAILFMIGSFFFALGSYVNALSIFEAPKSFRTILISVTTCYQFGGLFFIAGTMGYVEAFQPNLTMKWVATWFYMVGCGFYVAGSFLSFVSTVASHQVKWERLQQREEKKQRLMARMVGKATSALKRRNKSGNNAAGSRDREDADAESGERGEAGPLPEEPGGNAYDREEVDLDLEAESLPTQAELDVARALQEDDEEDDVFGAFWRSMMWDPNASPATSPTAASGDRGGTGKLRNTATSSSAADGSSQIEAPNAKNFKDNLSLLKERG